MAPEHGIAYRWEKRLGGWRRSRPDAPDTALRNRPFAGYAAHMRSEPVGTSGVDGHCREQPDAQGVSTPQPAP
jgi:hypothetical protein